MNIRTLKVGDKVMFKSSVVSRCGHSKEVADMRGIILSSEMCNKNVVRVDTQGTYNNEEGNPIRYIPIANLTKAN